MKRFVYILSVMVCLISQDYHGLEQGFFFDRPPSMRAEAMGKSGVTDQGFLSSAFFNPANISTIGTLSFEYSISSKYFVESKAKFDYLSFGSKLAENHAISFSYRKLDYNDKILVTSSEVSNRTIELDHSVSTISGTYAYSFSKNFHAGISLNYFEYHLSENYSKPLFVDLGISYNIAYNEASELIISASTTNIFKSKLEDKTSLANFGDRKPYITPDESLPIISRIGLAYRNLDYFKEGIGFYFHTEYQTVLNSDDLNAYKFGNEFTFYDLVFLRVGYYYKEEPYNISNKKSLYLDATTIGVGLKLKMKDYINIPLDLKIDYAFIPQPNIADPSFVKIESTSGISIQIDWDIE